MKGTSAPPSICLLLTQQQFSWSRHVIEFSFKLKQRIPFPSSILRLIISEIMTKNKSIFINLLRLLALAATVAAIVVMVTSHQSTVVLNLTFTAKYSNEPVFKYFVIAEAIAGGYSLLVLILFSKQSKLWRLIIILDVAVTALLTSGISAALAIAHVGKKGNSHAGWLPICEQVPKFCDHVTGALVSGFVSAIVYLVLLLSSMHAILSPVIALNP